MLIKQHEKLLAEAWWVRVSFRDRFQHYIKVKGWASAYGAYNCRKRETKINLTQYKLEEMELLL